MKEFKKSNEMSYNLMAFTGFKSLLLVDILLKSPKSYQEIKEIFNNHPYLKESISIDALRVYINTLKHLGFVIEKSKKSEGSKYKIVEYPFEFKFSDNQIKSVIHALKTLAKCTDIEELLIFTKFTDKIIPHIKNDKYKEELKNASPLTKIDLNILETLIDACKKHERLSILYKSPSNPNKEIDVSAEKITILNNKIYLYGKSTKYKNKASFLVSKIKKINQSKVFDINQNNSEFTIVGCEIYDNNILLANNEKLISSEADKRIIEITSDNLFFTKQRILALGKNCKVLYPEDFKNEIIATLKNMQEVYIAK